MLVVFGHTTGINYLWSGNHFSTNKTKSTTSSHIFTEVTDTYTHVVQHDGQYVAQSDALLTQNHDGPTDANYLQSQHRSSSVGMAGDSLAEFLSRPRRIDSFEWAVGTELSRTVYPWHAFFRLPLVRKKTNGYSRFRGSLKLQIMINGSPFHAGTAYAAYLPLGDERRNMLYTFNDGIITTVPATGVGCPNGATYHSFGSTSFFSGSVGTRRLVPLSQRQHVRLYPGENAGGEMELPFVFPAEYVSMGPDFASANTTTSNDVAACMGSLVIQSLGNLTFLGDNAPDAADVTIYASLVPGFEMMGPTVYDAQSEPITGTLAHTEVASEPTRAVWSEVVSAVGAAAARAMGFSNPPVISHVDAVRVQGIANLANTQLSTRDEVMAMDPNAALVSSRGAIGDDDEHLISQLAARESYLTAFSWPAVGAGSSSGSILFQASVSPVAAPTLSRTGTQNVAYEQVFNTPLSWLSEAFEMWSGEITYGFEVITTKFQKGRLVVTYDPLCADGAFSSTSRVGAVKSHIIDISENSKHEFTVPWCATSPYLQTGTNYTGLDRTVAHRPTFAPAYFGASYANPNSSPMYDNGLIAVEVLNTLTNNLDARVIVTIKSYKIKFAVPRSIPQNISLQDAFFAQSEYVAQSSDVDEYVGEKVQSIKDLCHRSTLITARSDVASHRGGVLKVPVTGVPRGLGLNSGVAQIKNGLLFAMGSSDQHSFYQWFASAFAAVRSSHRLQVRSSVGDNNGLVQGASMLITVVRGVSNIIDATQASSDIAKPFLSRRLAETLDAGADTNPSNLSVWNQEIDFGDGMSCTGSEGGGILVPCMMRSKFSPTNQYYDYYRPIVGQASGSLLGEPVWSAPTGTETNTLNELAAYYTPVDSVAILGPIYKRYGGSFQIYTSAGSDLAFAYFTNAPCSFKVSSMGTYTRGAQDIANASVAAKLNRVITAGTIAP